MATKNQVYIAVIGAGGVGKCFLSQLRSLAARKPSPKLNLCYVSSSYKVLYNEDYTEVSMEGVAESLAASSKAPPALSKVIDYLAGRSRQGDPGRQHQLARCCRPPPRAQRSTTSRRVGAGLPVISTLKDLVETGDKVTKIEGVFSGTMSFLFNSFAPTSGQGGAWSEEVKKAKSLGYTEPDPRDDLNGLDVARKLTILARLVGLPVESPTAFPVQSLIPKELESCGSGDEFLEKLGAFDQQMEETKAKAQKGAGAGGEVTAMGVTGDLLKVVAQIS
ncbi:hypothetical protein G6O67_008317 [Ophiocordyceps sinensis]|uniref:Homoserine dehydrogenase n=1 Tax=Ophiocordyceps sinensis TaxID=72228 RepID=A0A8H4LT58_9HYPO|nr:hypothetical protein G6O67_008317 [Ophiocordyceps sinensis]